MAKEKEIHDIQQDHFTQTTVDFTDHYEIETKELEKHLDKVSKEFMKTERENAAKNHKEYVATKFDKKRDELFNIGDYEDKK
jgi:aspartate carbamoyltransferase regulatory subunit